MSFGERKGTMESFKRKVREATTLVAERITVSPTIGVLAGTGLGDILEAMEDVVSVEYRDIPHFPVSTVVGHRGRFLCGKMAGRAVLAMQGRFHYYEGYGMQEITLPIRMMQLLGVKTLIVTNASGGINPVFQPGDIMLIVDHINLTGSNPLIGPNVDEWGPRFPDMSQVYNPTLMTMAEEAGARNGNRLQRGVYAGLCGPSLETRAEIRFLRTIGADAVGLSTIPEVIAASHGGMDILALSVITNMNLPDNPSPCHVDQVIATARGAAPHVRSIIEMVIERLPREAPSS
jgi:purine-nucleoside phosphorylase